MLTKSPPFRWPGLKRPRRSQRGRELPLRAELFGIDQLARHAETLAAQHRVVTGGASNRLLARLERNETVMRAFNRTTLVVDETRRVTPAAEWLLDNFGLIE